jgi:hypothetical protein
MLVFGTGNSAFRSSAFGVKIQKAGVPMLVHDLILTNIDKILLTDLMTLEKGKSLWPWSCLLFGGVFFGLSI